LRLCAGTPKPGDELVIIHFLLPAHHCLGLVLGTILCVGVPRRNHADTQDDFKGLREHLLAAGASGSGPPPYPTSSAPPPNPDNPYPPSESASPHDQYDPNAGAQPPYGMSGDSAGDDGLSPDARKGKRELSTSKRAAQNRAAQVGLPLALPSFIVQIV
jgi:hypothetical protein